MIVDDALVERFNSGDDAATAAVFQRYEPLLRAVVRRQLDARTRSKFDSVDVVQSVWADLVGGFRGGRWQFEDEAHLRAFLVRATRNRFLNRVRRHRAARDLEVAHDPTLEPTHAATPSQVVQADDRWQRLLADCPPAHRELLEMKRAGLPLDELATRTGLHPSSVRRILYDLAKRHAGVE